MFLLIIIGLLLGIIIYQCLVIRRLRGSSYKINGGDPLAIPPDEENNSSQRTNHGMLGGHRNHSVNILLPTDQGKSSKNKRVYQNDSFIELKQEEYRTNENKIYPTK